MQIPGQGATALHGAAELQGFIGPRRLLALIFFRPVGAGCGFVFYPRLTPWAAFLRRFAARHKTFLVNFSDGPRALISAERGRVNITQASALESIRGQCFSRTPKGNPSLP